MQIRCPDARIILLNLTTIASGDNYGLNGNGDSVEQFREAVRDIGKIYGYPVIETADLGVNTYNTTKYLADTTHPNEFYHKLIGKKVAKFMYGLGYDEVMPS
jgi:hypothetical protein